MYLFIQKQRMLPRCRVQRLGLKKDVKRVLVSLRCGNKSGHHQNKTTFKDDRDEYFEGHSRQDKVRLDEKRRHSRRM